MLFGKGLSAGTAVSGWNLANAVYSGQSFFVQLEEATPTGVFFKPDGTKMYVVGSTGDDVNQYTLSTAWDISTASFTQLFSVAAQTILPTGVSFKDDGTRMYVADANKLFTYVLDSAWDISTARVPNTFSVAAQETVSNGVFFKPDGTKMYVVGSSGDDVNEYNLSTAWDVSSAVFSQVFSVSVRETVPTGLFFKDDGLKMYVVGSDGDEVNQYALSTAWDISTASFVYVTPPMSGTKSATEQTTKVMDVFFKDDGTKMYIVADGATDAILEYALSIAWVVSSATYTSSFSVATQETTPEAIFFKPDGTQMYVMGTTGDDVNQYALSTAWNVTTASFVRLKSIAGQELTPTGLFFSPDGTKMYVTGEAGDDVNEYTLSTAWDISTASFVQVFSVSAQETNPEGLFFRDDGLKMYVVGSTGDVVDAYTLSTAWNISTATYTNSSPIFDTIEGQPTGVFFKPDGTLFYISGDSADSVFTFYLSTPWDVSTATQVLTLLADPADVTFNPDGDRMYVLASTTKYICEFELSTPWATSTITSLANMFSVAAQETVPTGLFFKPDGTQMYVLGSNGDDVNQYTLSTAWDISTASFVRLFSVAAQETVPQGLFFKPDGTQMYVVGSLSDAVYQYELSTAWDISTAYFPGTFVLPTGTADDLFFSPDGTKLYTIGSSADAVYQYALSTAWDVGPTTYIQSFSVAAQETVPTGLFFKPDGTQMYVLGSTGDDVNQYTLSTAWDISTASFVRLFSVAAQETVPTGLFFQDDGKKMYVVGQNTDTVYAYNL
jgi:DNA-binding beta-propeller fold protein YncE